METYTRSTRCLTLITRPSAGTFAWVQECALLVESQTHVAQYRKRTWTTLQPYRQRLAEKLPTVACHSVPMQTA